MEENLRNALIEANKSIWDKTKISEISEEGLYEVWFTMVNDHERGEAYWIRYTLMVPKKIISIPDGQDLNEFIDTLGGDGMLWLGYFNGKDSSKNFMIKKKYPLSAVQGSENVSDDKFRVIKIQDTEIYLDNLKGKFETQLGKKVSWDLIFTHLKEPYIGTPDAAKKLGLTNSLSKATHPNLRISGIITLNGDSKDIKDASGTQYHTYGDGYLVPWSWFNVHTFKEAPDGYMDFAHKVDKGIIELFDGEKSLTPWNVSLPKKMKVMSLIKREKSLTNLPFEVEFKGVSLKGEVSVPHDALVAVEYIGPQGNSFYCHNSELADLKVNITIKNRDGTIKEERDFTAEKSVSFETVYAEPQEGIEYLPWDKEEL